jgi:Tol biopolymer transport system component
MKRLYWLILITIVILGGLGSGIAAWVRAPRLLEVSPAPGGTRIPPFTPVRLTFSSPIQNDSLTNRITIQPARQGAYAWEENTLIFTPSQPWPSGGTITVQVSAGIRSSQAISLPMHNGKTWSFMTSQTLLAYLWPAAGEADLYTLDPITGDVQRITTTQNILDYAASLDGRWFYYSVETADGTAIWRQPRAEAGQAVEAIPAPETLLECPGEICRSITPSPDGEWLAFERTAINAQEQPGSTTVWLFDLSKQSIHQVSQPGHTTLHPGWSALGWLLFYDNERRGFVVQETSNKEIGFMPNETGETGSWHPNGSTFAAKEIVLETFSSAETLTNSHLMVYNLTQQNSRGEAGSSDLTQAADLEDAAPVYSPDGEWIAIARRYLDNARWTPGRQLWLVKADGSKAHPLTQADDYSHHDFAWSLDGKRLAFVRFNQMTLTEPAELWLIDADGSHLIELVKGGTAPLWLP